MFKISWLFIFIYNDYLSPSDQLYLNDDQSPGDQSPGDQTSGDQTSA